ncbi:hypothetical protein MK079_01920 [Candidatus Gracilibacteria bacterium]|nr:hypothetical protein [Candidatus Gracilibacteria bacterium]
MTQFTIDDPKITSKYDAFDLKLKFTEFLEKDLKNDHLEAYSFGVEDLPAEFQKKHQASFDDNFVKFVA